MGGHADDFDDDTGRQFDVFMEFTAMTRALRSEEVLPTDDLIAAFGRIVTLEGSAADREFVAYWWPHKDTFALLALHAHQWQATSHMFGLMRVVAWWKHSAAAGEVRAHADTLAGNDRRVFEEFVVGFVEGVCRTTDSAAEQRLTLDRILHWVSLYDLHSDRPYVRTCVARGQFVLGEIRNEGPLGPS